MRIQPVVAGVALAAAALIGVIVYFAIKDETDVAQEGTTSPAQATTFTSEEFAVPVSVSLPDGWVAYESREAVVASTPVEESGIAERIVIFRTAGGAPEVDVFTGEFEDGTPTAEPWPAEFAAWLSQHPNFEAVSQERATVGGSAATMFEARSMYEPPPDLAGGVLRIILIGAPHEGTDVSMLPGEMAWRFILFDDRDLAIAYGASADRFSEDRVETFIDGLILDEEPSGS
ncbi:MAG: hypothetical protein ACRDGV_06075 [Candidatus Limnocylindria bacterium]